jgi:DNA-directed RNA polymerase subunit alpha
LNPKLHIATLDDDATFNMEIHVEKGQGYVPGDKNKKQDQPIGLIPVDSIYSPITRVKFGVTDTRVGNVTNYDKLTLEVWTDGSIMPDEAVNAASGIMIGYLRLFEIGKGSQAPVVKVPEGLQQEERCRTGKGPAPIPMMIFACAVRSNNCLRPQVSIG